MTKLLAFSGQRWILRQFLWIGATLLPLISPPPAASENVGAITSITLRLLPGVSAPGGPEMPLDLDPNDGAQGLTHFSIPPGRSVEFKARGVAAGPGGVFMELMDYDLEEFMRGFDDELTSNGDSPGPMGEFVIQMVCSCPNGWFTVSDLEDSGEQSAELYLRDGEKAFPADRILPGGKKKRGFWRIDCDKDTTRTFNNNGEEMKTNWGDSLSIPPGAIQNPTPVRMANMYPLKDAESVPSEYLPISEAISLEPYGLFLQQPAALTFLYTQEEVGETADEATLEVFKYDSLLAQWILNPGAQVDPTNNHLRIEINQFAVYGFSALRPDFVQAVQTTQTEFGDNSLGRVDLASGSELVSGGALLRDGRLHLFLAGNLESNFNNLEIFLDARPGGQNRLRGDNPQLDFDGLNRMGDDGSGNGLTFDEGFLPDYWIGLTGGDLGTGYQLHANYAVLETAGGGIGYYMGQTRAAGNGTLIGGTNPHGIRVAIDNSNTQGIDPGCGTAAVQPDVWTGVDLSIPIQALGGPSSCIRICAFVNGVGHDFVSNQMLGPLPNNTCNLGEPRAIDLAWYPGDQYFEVCDGTIGISPVIRVPILSASPNPFLGRVEIRAWHAIEPPAILEIFDIGGRKVRTLSGRDLQSGGFTWDGRAEGGEHTGPGLYFARLRGSRTSGALRLVKLR